MVIQFVRRIVRTLPLLWKYDLELIDEEESDIVDIGGQLYSNTNIDAIIKEWQDRSIII